VYIVLHLKYPLFLLGSNESCILLSDLKKYSNTKFHEYPSSGSQVVPCGWKDG